MFGTPQLALPAPAAGYTNNIYGITHDLDKTTADSVASEMYYGRGVADSFYAFFDFWSLQANADLNIPLAKTAGSSDSVFTTTKDLYVTTNSQAAAFVGTIDAYIYYEVVAISW